MTTDQPSAATVDLPAVALRLRQAIAALGINQTDFCASIGVPYPTLRNYLAATRTISAEFLVGAMRVHRISPAWLLTGAEPMTLSAGGYGAGDGRATVLFTGEDGLREPHAYIAAEPMAAWKVPAVAPATNDTTHPRGAAVPATRPARVSGALIPHRGTGDVRPLVLSLPVGEVGGQAQSVEYFVVPKRTRPASAGHGFGGIDDVVDLAGEVAYTASWLQRNLDGPVGTITTVQVDGSSMAPTLMHGETILIDEGIKAVDKDGIYVLERYNSRRVKRVHKRMDGGLVLISDNPAYPPEVLDRADAQLIDVVGRMIMPRVK